MTKIIHGIYTYGSSVFEEAKEFEEFIKEKYEKFSEKYDHNFIVYTVGMIHGIKAIAIVHPFDEFNWETSTDIVTGRIKRQLGLQKWTDIDYVVHKAPYDETGEWVDEDGLFILPPYIKVIA